MDRLEALQAELRQFAAERDWDRFHDPKNLAMAVASEAGELLAVLRWVHSDEADAACREPGRRAALAEEIADVAITLLMLCERTGIDLIEAVRRKIEANRARYPVPLARGRPDRPRREPAQAHAVA
ncbi:MAG: nucleotide pyrophosphohydrolase [Planctomycetota bacterium]|nr:MAG: nucleotide pyrophosphohydrolase [Planctomycetota bacterium]